ncbi:MAG: hypothetical protein KGS72_04730 [Cyanobacteria bacterium REEB67]|nr:hypothetical protein [Cyanobacteria bacterium REEB67]
MKTKRTTFAASLLSLSACCSLVVNFPAGVALAQDGNGPSQADDANGEMFGDSTGAVSSGNTSGATGANTVTRFLAGQAKLDMTVTPKIKPFTLGVSQHAEAQPLNAGAQDSGLAAGNGILDNSASALKASADNNRFRLQAEKEMRILSRFNFELLVDRSLSMHQTDCPDGVSRWEWCGMQAASMALALTPVATQGMTIVPFATEYDVFENASANHIAYLFDNMRLQTGTRLFEPLAEQADRYFADHSPNKKPLLIVVVTDGLPVPRVEPERVRQELVDISNRMKNPHDVTVIFCQIGAADGKGLAYLEDLDQNLTTNGARYNFVHTITFDDLQQRGLGGALASTMQQYAPAPPLPPAPKQSVAARISRPSAPGRNTSHSAVKASLAHIANHSASGGSR